MVRPQYKPHHPGTPLSHTGTLGSGEGDHSPPIVLSRVVGKPPYTVALRDFQGTFCFGRPFDPLGALAVAAIPKATTPLASNLCIDADGLLTCSI